MFDIGLRVTQLRKYNKKRGKWVQFLGKKSIENLSQEKILKYPRKLKVA
jgi:hypothetical protein